jgi:3alpha(or 20beta)-hydroxysteroid dehydrogenase
VAIVTGAARCTGEATARLFVREGARVLLGDVLDEAGAAVAKDLGAAALYRRLDVRREEDWAAAVAAVRGAFGPVDVLVNNAAVLDVAPLEATDPGILRELLDVNLVGPLLGIRAVIPEMEEQGGGSIVNLGSIDALEGMGWVAAYAASKWGLRGLTKSAALELGPRGIRVNLVCPAGGGDMAGPFVEQLRARIRAGEKIHVSGLDHRPQGERHVRPEDVAAMVLFLASDEGRSCNGGDYPVDGGHTAGHIAFRSLPGAS